MKKSISVALLSILASLSLKANSADQGTIKNISCINSEMNSEEIKAASGSFLGLKIGHVVSLKAIRQLAVNENGESKSGMGLIENSSKLILLVKADGFCQKSKILKSDDGSEKTVTTVGTTVLTIQK
jgi:hypothetical protein